MTFNGYSPSFAGVQPGSSNSDAAVLRVAEKGADLILQDA